MATAAEIREKALKKLGIKAIGNATQSEIQADLDEAYTEVYAMIDTLDLATWDIDDEVPDEFVQAVKDWVAYLRVDEYSIPNDRYQRIVRDAMGDGTPNFPGSEARIKKMQASNVYKQPTAEYF
jgi:hypothetical protein